MVSMNQVQLGLARYIDSEILPHLSGAKKIGLGIYSSLAAQNLSNFLNSKKDHPAISMLNIIDPAGNVDIDKVYQAAVHSFPEGEKVRMDIPLIGELILDRSDLEKVYRYIKDS